MPNLIHQITSGMVGWLTYEQMRSGVDNLNEARLGPPLECIADGRGYEAKAEFQLPRPAGSTGGPQRIDFLMVNRERQVVVALETKYKKAGRRMQGGLGIDAAKLHGLTLNSIDAQIAAGQGGGITAPVAGFQLVRAVLVVWHQTTIMEQLRREPILIQKQFIDLVAALLPDDVEPTSRNFSRAMLGELATKPVARASGSLRAGSTVTRKRFWVASLMHRANWARL